MQYLINGEDAGYIKTDYTANRMILVGTGGIDHTELVKLAEKHFSSLPQPLREAGRAAAEAPQAESTVHPDESFWVRSSAGGNPRGARRRVCWRRRRARVRQHAGREVDEHDPGGARARGGAGGGVARLAAERAPSWRAGREPRTHIVLNGGLKERTTKHRVERGGHVVELALPALDALHRLPARDALMGRAQFTQVGVGFEWICPVGILRQHSPKNNAPWKSTENLKKISSSPKSEEVRDVNVIELVKEMEQRKGFDLMRQSRHTDSEIDVSLVASPGWAQNVLTGIGIASRMERVATDEYTRDLGETENICQPDLHNEKPNNLQIEPRATNADTSPPSFPGDLALVTERIRAGCASRGASASPDYLYPRRTTRKTRRRRRIVRQAGSRPKPRISKAKDDELALSDEDDPPPPKKFPPQERSARFLPSDDDNHESPKKKPAAKPSPSQRKRGIRRELGRRGARSQEACRQGKAGPSKANGEAAANGKGEEKEQEKEEAPKEKFKCVHIVQLYVRSWAASRAAKLADPAAPGSKAVPDGAPKCLAGLSFVLTSELSSFSSRRGRRYREALRRYIKIFHSSVVGQPSSKTSYFVLGDDAGPSKLNAIKNTGLQTVRARVRFGRAYAFTLGRRMCTGTRWHCAPVGPARAPTPPPLVFPAPLVGCVVALSVPTFGLPRTVGTHHAHLYKVAERAHQAQRAETLAHDEEQTVSSAA
ncbi:hypothetical protein B0H11DRAFT_1944230 [Mycena galericulata]|nr:hypothetical protein B0H11DRAFT_1944230 [Mycena galericulata]